MLDNFFHIGPLPQHIINGTYDFKLVLLSFCVSVFASYIALDITGRLREFSTSEGSRLWWLLGGAIAMGTGIWAMHFIGMLSFTLPGMMMSYELFWTLLSLIVAILASAFALHLLKMKVIHYKRLALGGILLGVGIAAMHYTGMEGMRMDVEFRYLPGLFVLSIVIAIVASEAALWLALHSNRVIPKKRVSLKIISAIIMGVAICGMHYTGMSAAVFSYINGSMMANHTSLDPAILSMGIAASTIVILAIAFFASTYKESITLEQLEKARQLGMAEVSASVLHNVGNILNSVNVSTNILFEKITHTKLAVLKEFAQLIEENRNNLAHFITHTDKGKKIPQFIAALSQCQQNEQKEISDEVQLLMNNIQLIENIISMQQNLSKTIEIEQYFQISDIVEEALLITEANFKSRGIAIEKDFAHVHPILIDKIKCLQILVNIFRNAKESLLESKKPHKVISIEIKVITDILSVVITDNGVGIAPDHLKKIFTYGYTTKTSGHGYGLHSSILSSRSMGGNLKVESQGLGKGASFILELPYNK